jgi:MFS family permease
MTSLFHAFRSLRNRNYRLFWFGQFVSLAGTWMQDLALSWLVLTLTKSPAALGLLIAIRFLPSLLFSLYGGVLADRLRKRRAMIYCEAGQLVVALTLAVLIDTRLITLGIIYGLAAARGMIDAIEGPTRQAFVPEMVGTNDLSNAIALNSTQFNAARIIGPAIGGLVLAAVGFAACFYLNARASWPSSSRLAMRVASCSWCPVCLEPALTQLRDGLHYARSSPHVVLVLIVMGAIGALGTTTTLTCGPNTCSMPEPALALLTTSRASRSRRRSVRRLSRPADSTSAAGLATFFVVMLAAVVCLSGSR